MSTLYDVPTSITALIYSFLDYDDHKNAESLISLRTPHDVRISWSGNYTPLKSISIYDCIKFLQLPIHKIDLSRQRDPILPVTSMIANKQGITHLTVRIRELMLIIKNQSLQSLELVEPSHSVLENLDCKNMSELILTNMTCNVPRSFTRLSVDTVVFRKCYPHIIYLWRMPLRVKTLVFEDCSPLDEVSMEYIQSLACHRGYRMGVSRLIIRRTVVVQTAVIPSNIPHILINGKVICGTP
jgi:hypothetical protein